MKRCIKLLSMFLIVSLFVSVLVIPASAGSTTRYTLDVGDTKYLYTNSNKAVIGASWTTSDYKSVQILSQNSFSCQIEVVGPSTANYVIIHCTYYYYENFNGYMYQRSDYTDYYITVNPVDCTVTFNPNGGTVSTTRKTVSVGETYGTLPTPTRTGYSFNGWYTGSSGGTRITSTKTVTNTSDHTLYAHWSPLSYKVTFDPNGGTVTTTSKSVPYNSQYGTLPKPVREGYCFTGWYTEAGARVTSSTYSGIAKNHTLYAQWATSHQEVADPAVAPTCTETGLTEGSHCSVCQEVLTAPTIVDALGHTEVPMEAKAPACTETGLTEGIQCSVCQTVLMAQEEIPALGHSYVEHICERCAELEYDALQAYGTCGDALAWILDLEGNLHIFGTGSMMQYADPAEIPWCAERASVKTLTVDEGVSGIDANAFHGCENLTEITFKGDAPIFMAPEGQESSAFGDVDADAYYPENNDTWTEAVMQDYGGSITWIPLHLQHSWGDWVIVIEPSCTSSGETRRECGGCEESETHTVNALGHSPETIPGKDATCTEGGLLEGIQCSRCYEKIMAQEGIPALGHTPETVPGKGATCGETGLTVGVKCSVCQEILQEQEVLPVLAHTPETIPGQDPTCTQTGLTEGIRCSVCLNMLTAQEEIPPLGHDFLEGSCSRCGNPQYTGVTRIAGGGRYATAVEVAAELKDTLAVEMFDTIIIASGESFPDALSGTYLATVTHAPILLMKKDGHDTAMQYIEQNLAPGGKIYLLGGENTISRTVETKLGEYGTVKRLAGSGRYDTCLEILKEASNYATSNEVLVCSANERTNANIFADSLSASAVGKPILLIDGSGTALTDGQKEYLAGKNYVIIGGENTVTPTMAAVLSEVAVCEKRLSGKNRVETSVEIARYFFPSPDAMILADGGNYPDGLCGGALANAKGLPILLTAGREAVTAGYAADYGIRAGYVVGGANSVTDAAARTIFGLDSDYVID